MGPISHAKLQPFTRHERAHQLQPLRTLHLFAGLGGGILADIILGHRPVCAIEIRPYCQRVLAQRQQDGHLPFFPIYPDVRAFSGKPWRGLVDVVSGGFPCQPFSSASRGRRVAIDLWPEMRRIVAECRPRWVFAENVIDAPIRRAADDLYALGYSSRYCRLDAADVGAPHRRKRWWLVAYSDGHSEPSRPVYVQVARQSRVPGLAWWADDISGSLGVDDGDAPRMERLQTLGNAQIPIVAAWAWRLLGEGYGADR